MSEETLKKLPSQTLLGSALRMADRHGRQRGTDPELYSRIQLVMTELRRRLDNERKETRHSHN